MIPTRPLHDEELLAIADEVIVARGVWQARNARGFDPRAAREQMRDRDAEYVARLRRICRDLRAPVPDEDCCVCGRGPTSTGDRG